MSSLEGLASIKHFGAGRIFDWTVLRTRAPSFVDGVSAVLLDRLMMKRGVSFVFFARLAAAAYLAISVLANRGALMAATVVLAASLYLNVRAPYGLDGSDQMSALLFVAITISQLGARSPSIAVVCLWFLAVQGCLSYASAGIAKLASPVWRRGHAIHLIIDTEGYGSALPARMARCHPNTARAITWGTILFECMFVGALFLGPTGAFILAIWAALFHIATALVMGLNTFVWAFLAVHPAIIYCAYQI